MSLIPTEEINEIIYHDTLGPHLLPTTVPTATTVSTSAAGLNMDRLRSHSHDYPHHHIHHPSTPPKHTIMDNLLVTAESSLAGATGHGLLTGKQRKTPMYTRSYIQHDPIESNVFVKKGI